MNLTSERLINWKTALLILGMNTKAISISSYGVYVLGSGPYVHAIRIWKNSGGIIE